jgi:tetratricopeptide (TPR) repeat protein
LQHKNLYEKSVKLSNLYLAEIESLHLKRKDLALTRLEAIERIKKPAGQLDAGYDIYKSWAAYQHTKISRGKIEAARQLVAYPEILSAHFLAVTQLDLSGIAGDPLIGCAGSDRRIDIVIDTLIARIIKNTASPIDKSLTRLGYGYAQQYKKNFAEAEKHYSALLEDDSFFSPVAGLYLAKVKKAKGDTAQAEATLEKVKTQYPGYKSEVIKVKESWKKGR